MGIKLSTEQSPTVFSALRTFGHCLEGLEAPVVVGWTQAGELALTDLAAAHHLLVAGATGSGKSTFLHAALIGLISAREPQELKLCLIDPKSVEFAVYASAPHLLAPVISEAEEAESLLEALIAELQRRFGLLLRAGCRDLAGYNRHRAREGLSRLPRLVLVVDEYGDFVLGQRPIERKIVRLVQKGRAAGMHLILATQRPTRDLVTGHIKANIPARVAMRVSSAMESRIILERRGAETLRRHGDLLFLDPQGTLSRLRGVDVTEEELRYVRGFWG